MYLSHGLTEILALQFLEAAPYEVLLRGHCGELAKTSLAWPMHTDETVYTLKSSGALVDHMLRRFNTLSDFLGLSKVFTRAAGVEMSDGPRASLEASVKDVPLSPAELCSYLYLHEHHRRFTIPSLDLFRNAVEIRLPFADDAFLAVLLSGAPEWRDSTDLHRAIVARYDPRLLNVRDSNTGASLQAGRLTLFVADKLNTVLKRLNVPGYRHYHQFDKWMERMLVQAVESELLSPRSLDRGILRREGLEDLLAGARRRERGCAYALQVLLILELWQQENVDPPHERSRAN
jgi:asparagine synthase (glutamine-hydrolysing)